MQRKHKKQLHVADLITSSPFFFVYCRMRFLILGRSVGKEKKRNKKKLEKESGTGSPGILAQYPWSLEATRRGHKVNMAAMEEGKIDVVVGRSEKKRKETKKNWKRSLELGAPVSQRNIRGAWKQQDVVIKSTWQQWRKGKSTSWLNSSENSEKRMNHQNYMEKIAYVSD